MACCAVIVPKAARILWLGFVFVATMLPASLAGASPNLQVVICRDTPASVTISQPEGDSVVSVPEIELSGDVFQSGELEIYVDDAFNGVEPLAYDMMTYTTTIHLSPGTHTIKIIAVDVCQVGNATASVVLTYQPVATPSVGGSVPTNVGGLVTGSEKVSSSQNNLIEQFVLSPLSGMAESLDLITHDSVKLETSFANMIRFMAIVSGLLMIGFAQSLQVVLVGLSNKISADLFILSAVQANVRKVIIGIGAVVIAAVFMM